METIAVKMSSKGQIAIPRKIRMQINADEGTMFAAVSHGDSIVLKKIKVPSTEEILKNLRVMAKDGAKRAKKLGIKLEDVPSIIQEYRKSKNEGNNRY